jgi:hypothetical protein
MTQVGVEQVRFQDQVATEPRFAFRRWFETWVEGINSGSREVWQPAVLEVITVSDLLEKDLDYDAFTRYVTTPPKQFRVPSASVAVEDGLYVVRGSLEIFSAGMMVFEGTFEMAVHDIGKYDFKIFSITCYPHFRVSF